MKNQIRTILPGTLNFRIPPQARDHVLTANYLIHEDMLAISLYPHMHLRGRAQTIVAHYPDGRSETLLNVPKWDFGWQLMFYPTEPIPLPRGTQIEVTAHYDNTPNNPWLELYGGNPDLGVTWGNQSTDEMMFGMIEVIAAKGVALGPLTEEARLSALLARYPADTLYRVDLKRASNSTASVLHLPPRGEGTWYLFGGLTQWSTMPIADLVWTGEEFVFETRLDLPRSLRGAFSRSEPGAMNATLTVRGSIGEDGSIRGEFIPAGVDPGIEPFEGARVTLGG
ncbi:hypothetical protein IIC65_01825 [Candidatus Sumerlaeota bacterium]|nr:hypothetical protein [Candidatus Sumerlaeota bacterium]